MEFLIACLKAFLVGGAFCVIGQLLIDKTRLTPARILTSYVVAGVPLTGFGNTLAKGVREAVAESGVLGAFTGGITASAAGIAAAIFFGFLVALIFKPKDKS